MPRHGSMDQHRFVYGIMSCSGRVQGGICREREEMGEQRLSRRGRQLRLYLVAVGANGRFSAEEDFHFRMITLKVWVGLRRKDGRLKVGRPVVKLL